MQVVLNADKESYVQNTVIKGGVEDLSYYTPPSFPVISKANNEMNPTGTFSGAPDNQTHTFELLPAGIHYLARCKFNGIKDFAVGESVTFNILNMIRNVQFFSNSQPILSMSGEAFKVMTMNNTAPFQEHAYRYGMALNPVTEEPITTTPGANIPFVTFLPLHGSWYTAIEKALNTTKIQRLQISITYKGYTESGMSAPCTEFKAKLENFTYSPDQETLNKMVTKDFSSSIIMQCFDTKTERMQLPAGFAFNAGATTTRFEFASETSVPAYKTHIFIAKTNTLGAAPIYGCPYLPISAISIDFGGVPYVTNYTKSMMNYEQAVRGNSCHIIGPVITTASSQKTSSVGFNENQCITADWSLLCTRDENTGLVAMRNLGKPNYVIDIAPFNPTATGEQASSYTVFVVHEYWSILNTDPASKTISVAASV